MSRPQLSKYAALAKFRLKALLYPYLGGLVYQIRARRNAKALVDFQPPELGDTSRPVTVTSLDQQPDVSIVIPVHGQLARTQDCLHSIVQAAGSTTWEIVVVDDASPDETAAWLERCAGVRVVSLESNVGYLQATNRGAAEAQGQFICLLNNDTVVHDGWLDTLVSTFDEHPSVGAVGAMLLYPNGWIQEAGGVVFTDGSAANFGNRSNPAAWQFGHVREVDYCSAACLVLRTEQWHALGGFDDRYTPAYYEDTDLCFRIRERGGRVLIQPSARVTHHEGSTHGTETDTGLKTHQVTNQAVFASRWKQQLVGHHQPPPATNKLHVGDRRGRPHVVVIDHEVPAPDHDSGSVRMSAILRALQELGCRVTFVPMNRGLRSPYGNRLQRCGVAVLHSWPTLRPMLRLLGLDVSLIVLSRPEVARAALDDVRETFPGVPVIYDMVDFHGLRVQRRAAQQQSGEEAAAEKMAELERRLVASAELTFAITTEEQELIAAQVPTATVEVLPNIHESSPSTASFASRSGVLFVGSYNHLPNRDAVMWLVQEIMPAVWQTHPQIAAHVVGSNFPDDFVDTDGLPVTLHGWVEDLDPIFDQVRLSVAPLRFGAGLKGKVGDSMMRGVPVVATPVGCEGFSTAARFIRRVEDGPETTAQMAAAIIALHEDEDAWQRLAEGGREAVGAEFGYEAAKRVLAQTLEQLGVSNARS